MTNSATGPAACFQAGYLHAQSFAQPPGRSAVAFARSGAQGRTSAGEIQQRFSSRLLVAAAPGVAAHRHRSLACAASGSRVVGMAAAGKPVVRVDIWSDLSCPWCWVGKKRFDKAVEQFASTADFEIVYHSYVIDHGTAPAGEEYLAYNVRRWGSDGWCRDLRRSGRPDGAAFSDWCWWPNSVRAHQLLLLAQAQGKGREAKEALLRATYEEGKNISEVGALVEIGQGLSLEQSAEELRGYLERDAGRAAVLADDSRGKRELDISGVPYFIVGHSSSSSSSGSNEEGGSGRRYALSGAQPAAAFAQAFSKVLGEQSQ